MTKNTNIWHSKHLGRDIVKVSENTENWYLKCKTPLKVKPPMQRCCIQNHNYCGGKCNLLGIIEYEGKWYCKNHMPDKLKTQNTEIEYFKIITTMPLVFFYQTTLNNIHYFYIYPEHERENDKIVLDPNCILKHFGFEGHARQFSYPGSKGDGSKEKAESLLESIGIKKIDNTKFYNERPILYKKHFNK